MTAPSARPDAPGLGPAAPCGHRYAWPGASGSAVLIERLVTAMADAIAHHAPELTELDRAIGDADHGTNMQRGFEALRRARFEWDGAAPCEALERAGMTLVMSIGGAAGPLYGSLLLGMARAGASGAGLVDQIGEGVACVKRRGRVEAGAKTLVDVLEPVLQAIRAEASTEELRRVSDRACAATRDMIATRGRAAYLGERARGHVDPGAASSRLLIHTICDVLGPVAVSCESAPSAVLRQDEA